MSFETLPDDIIEMIFADIVKDKLYRKVIEFGTISRNARRVRNNYRYPNYFDNDNNEFKYSYISDERLKENKYPPPSIRNIPIKVRIDANVNLFLYMYRNGFNIKHIVVSSDNTARNLAKIAIDSVIIADYFGTSAVIINRMKNVRRVNIESYHIKEFYVNPEIADNIYFAFRSGGDLKDNMDTPMLEYMNEIVAHNHYNYMDNRLILTRELKKCEIFAIIGSYHPTIVNSRYLTNMKSFIGYNMCLDNIREILDCDYLELANCIYHNSIGQFNASTVILRHKSIPRLLSLCRSAKIIELYRDYYNPIIVDLSILSGDNIIKVYKNKYVTLSNIPANVIAI